jgi:transposase
MHSKAATRRRHGDELKAKVLTECDEPGASVAAVAQAHGLNANLVHKWRRERRRPQTPAIEAMPADDKVASAFVALQLPPLPTSQPAPDIRIELRRGATTITMAWPGQAAGECAAWLGQWLR